MPRKHRKSPAYLAQIESVVTFWNDPEKEHSIAQIAKALGMTGGQVIGIVHRNRDRCPYRRKAFHARG